MNKITFGLLLSYLLCYTAGIYADEPRFSAHYTVDITNFDEDSFFVKLDLKHFDKDTAVYQFAVTAPGTYSILDVGRFVGSFRAFDAARKPLPIVRTDVNQFTIYRARSLSRITYRVDDTFDSPIQENRVEPMSGSNIERDNVLINGQMVFGYFHGHQSDPVTVKYIQPKKWIAGTSLKKKEGIYRASSFDELVDSPFMFGKLDRQTITMGRSAIDIYVYSQNQRFSADFVRERLMNVLRAADKFLDGLPVERYVFLFHFRENTGPVFGAWEHNYSSFYVIPEWGESYISGIVTSMAAHEFFHIVIPLNIHSEIISPFHFEKAIPSQHLWLYEGVTEWASDLMQVRYGTMSDTALMEQISEKLQRNDQFDPNVSLVDLSLGSYDQYESQYGNVYERGALTAMLLDIRLLELSQGKTGLRDVIKKLSQEFGPKRPFPEDGLFDLIVQMTYPEIGEFINRYIKGADPLPIREYLAKAGYVYEREAETGLYESNLGKFAFGFVNDVITVTHVDTSDSVSRRLEIQPGDVIRKLKYAGLELSVNDTTTIRAMTFALIGESFEWLVRRNGTEKRLKAFVGKRNILDYHVIRPSPSLSDEQKRLRRWWLGL